MHQVAKKIWRDRSSGGGSCGSSSYSNAVEGEYGVGESGGVITVEEYRYPPYAVFLFTESKLVSAIIPLADDVICWLVVSVWVRQLTSMVSMTMSTKTQASASARGRLIAPQQWQHPQKQRSSLGQASARMDLTVLTYSPQQRHHSLKCAD